MAQAPPVESRDHHAELELPCKDEATAIAIAASVAPELADSPDASHVAMWREGSVLKVRVTAGRAATLRAALHSVVRLVDAAQRTLG